MLREDLIYNDPEEEKKDPPVDENGNPIDPEHDGLG